MSRQQGFYRVQRPSRDKNARILKRKHAPVHIESSVENRIKPRTFEKKKKGTIITPTPWSNPSSISILTTSGRAIDNTDNPEAAPEGVKYSNDRGRRKHENDRARKRNCGWAECAHSFRGSTHASKPFDLYIEVNVAERERKRERGKKRSFSMEIRKLHSVQLFKLCKLWEITSMECVEI